MKTQQILATFLTVSAIALGVPAQASVTSDARAAGQEVSKEARESANAVGEFASDALITTKVKAALVADETVKAMDISVKTIDNVVYLSGRVDTAQQRETAERLAKQVDKVKSVVNHIQTKT